MFQNIGKSVINYGTKLLRKDDIVGLSVAEWDISWGISRIEQTRSEMVLKQDLGYCFN